MANLWQNQQNQKKRNKAAGGATQAPGFGKRAHKYQPGAGDIKMTANNQPKTAGRLLQGIDTAQRMRATGGTGTVDTGEWYNPDNRNPNSTRRNYPDLSHIPRSMGGTKNPGVRAGTGTVDKAAAARQRGLRAPGQQKPGIVSQRDPSTINPELLQLTQPPGAITDQLDMQDQRRRARTKRNSPNTMISAAQKLG